MDDNNQQRLFPEEKLSGVVIEAGRKYVEVIINLNGVEEIWKIAYGRPAQLGSEVAFYPSQVVKRLEPEYLY